MDAATHDKFMACRDYIHQALQSEMNHRPEHRDWVERERQAVADAAVEWAVANGMGQIVTAADVERVEGMAVGHFDYGPKLCLYVAEMVFGVREPVR